jgi:hypothetical protein
MNVFPLCALAARNNYFNFRDEAADTGDQRNLPLDLGRQMGFHECMSFRPGASCQFIGFL